MKSYFSTIIDEAVFDPAEVLAVIALLLVFIFDNAKGEGEKWHCLADLKTATSFPTYSYKGLRST